MTTEIKVLNLGIAATNCYIIGDTETNEAILIDPVDQAPLLHKTATEAGWQIKLILATHAHFDHILASKDLKDLTGAPFYTHHKSKIWLESLPEQGLRFTGQKFPEAATPDRLLTDAPETIELGAIKLETIYTPGHADDHISYYMPDRQLVFSGDCLFAGSIGRTDLPGGDYELLMQTITEKLLPLGDNTEVLPGHMQQTTIGEERSNNPFLLDYFRKKNL